jgi:hypothetical protein
VECEWAMRGQRGSGAAAEDVAGDGERSKVPYQADGRRLQFRRAPHAAAAAAQQEAAATGFPPPLHLW